ncbi:MAG: hypothetical protein KAS32_22615 [Candidatus Peribacteraceae bacterium]|nr:hypothetical protein [Candidatus Peribacteraceae bacterium]
MKPKYTYYFSKKNLDIGRCAFWKINKQDDQSYYKYTADNEWTAYGSPPNFENDIRSDFKIISEEECFLELI